MSSSSKKRKRKRTNSNNNIEKLEVKNRFSDVNYIWFRSWFKPPRIGNAILSPLYTSTLQMNGNIFKGDNTRNSIEQWFNSIIGSANYRDAHVENGRNILSTLISFDYYESDYSINLKKKQLFINYESYQTGADFAENDVDEVPHETNITKDGMRQTPPDFIIHKNKIYQWQNDTRASIVGYDDTGWKEVKEIKKSITFYRYSNYHPDKEELLRIDREMQKYQISLERIPVDVNSNVFESDSGWSQHQYTDEQKFTVSILIQKFEAKEYNSFTDDGEREVRLRAYDSEFMMKGIGIDKLNEYYWNIPLQNMSPVPSVRPGDMFYSISTRNDMDGTPHIWQFCLQTRGVDINTIITDERFKDNIIHRLKVFLTDMEIKRLLLVTEDGAYIQQIGPIENEMMQKLKF